MSEKLLTFDDVAEILAVHKNTVRRIVAAGQLPFVSIGANPKRQTKRFRRSDVLAYINSNATSGKAKPKRSQRVSRY